MRKYSHQYCFDTGVMSTSTGRQTSLWTPQRYQRLPLSENLPGHYRNVPDRSANHIHRLLSPDEYLRHTTLARQVHAPHVHIPRSVHGSHPETRQTQQNKRTDPHHKKPARNGWGHMTDSPVWLQLPDASYQLAPGAQWQTGHMKMHPLPG